MHQHLTAPQVLKDHSTATGVMNSDFKKIS